MTDEGETSRFQLKAEPFRRIPHGGKPVATLPEWGGVAESVSAQFILRPPVDYEIAYEVDRLLIILPFSSAACRVLVGDGPLTAARVRAGSAIVVPPGVCVRALQSEPVEFLVLSIDPRHFADIAGKAARGRSWALRVIDDLMDPAITAIAREIRRALLSDPLIEAGYLELLADAILARLTCQFITEREDAAGPEMLAPGVLARVVRHIDDHLGDDLKVDDLAEFAGYSRSHFSRAFQRSTGDGPQRFILKRRICRARDLISERRGNLTEIAASTGFSSQAHMTKAFRDELGVTPSRYRDAFPAPGGATPDQSLAE